MRGIKPFKLSFLTRPFSWGQAHHLGVSVLGYFSLDENPTLLTDAEMWTEIPEVMGKEFALDEGIPKSRAEFLLAGSAFQEGGRPGTVRHVKAQVGSITRALYVIGDREWRNGVQTEPLPFTSMPLTWANAFGGEGYDRNPSGKGFAPVDGGKRHPLPNIEIPGAMITSPKDRPAPASFGAVAFTSPDRLSMAGTYDKEWLDTRFPGFAKDMDWRMWNVASPEQQQEEPLVGDEAIVLEHLHPTRPRLAARLPGIVARCFLIQTIPGGSKLEEVGLRLTTVWLFPSIERGIVVFHGGHPIAEDDGHDIETILVAAERLGAPPRPREHYEGVLQRRLGPDGVFEALSEHDLMPEGMEGLGASMERHMEVTTTEQLRLARAREASNKKIEEARALVESYGLDPDEHGPSFPPPDPGVPSLAEAMPLMKKMLAEMDQNKAQAEALKQEQLAELEKLCEATGLSYDDMVAEMTTPPGGPPDFSARGQRAEMQRLSDEAFEQTGARVAELEHYATDEKVYEGWVEAEERMKQGYRMSAHAQSPAHVAPAEVSGARRAQVEAAYAAGESLRDWDLTGIDLRGIDLAGANLSRAFLESTNLSGARLDGANLEDAVLAHANLEAASLRGANLHGANIGAANLRSSFLNGANLTEGVLVRADFSDADLMGANLSEAQMGGAVLSRTRLADAELVNTTFQQLKLEGVVLTGANLTFATFMKVDANGVDFSGARLDDATFYQSTAEGALFADCEMSRFRVIESGFSRADFKRAKMDKALLRNIDLRGADFSGASLDTADFSGANLQGAIFYRIKARHSMWTRADLRLAKLISADLFEAMIDKADLRGADLRGANLYGANFALIHSDADTNVTDAIQDRVRILPQREAQ